MLADRWIFSAKEGKMEEAIALANAERTRILQETNYTGAFRIYLSYIGDSNKLVVETEWNNLAEWETWWANWRESPEGTAFQEKWTSLLEADGRIEVWSLVD